MVIWTFFLMSLMRKLPPLERKWRSWWGRQRKEIFLTWKIFFLIVLSWYVMLNWFCGSSIKLEMIDHLYSHIKFPNTQLIPSFRFGWNTNQWLILDYKVDPNSDFGRLVIGLAAGDLESLLVMCKNSFFGCGKTWSLVWLSLM